MARTKQTARKCMAFKGPRATVGGKGVVSVSSGKKGIKSAPSPSAMIVEPPEDVLDTQQFSIKFDDQAECEKKAVKGEFKRCGECEVILTAQSKILSQTEYENLKKEDSKKRLEKVTSDEVKQKYLETTKSVWVCEFCCHHNEIEPAFSVEKEQNPCFLVEESKKRASKKKNEEQQDSGQILIFCVDLSSSMEDNVDSTSKEPKNKLQCVQEAIVDELRNLRDKGNKKVGLITFSSGVTIFGDGNKPSKPMSCSMYDFDKIDQHAEQFTEWFSTAITKSFTKLKNAVQKLNSNGSTALGPALLAATKIASTGAIGSKVIICTDGEANTGLGNASDTAFYDRMGEYAKSKHVTVSVLTIKGAGCNVKMLGRVTSASGGSVMKVDPTKLGTEFSKVISDETLGANCDVIIRLNKRFKFRGVDAKYLSDHDRIFKDKLGNFSADTELTYAFDLIPAEEALALKHVNPELYNSKNLPMQVELSYTSPNGNRYLQVFTDWREITDDQSALFEDANFGLFAASILQKVSKCIKDEHFEEAEKLIDKYRKLCNLKFSKFKENADKIKKFNERVAKLESIIASKRLKKGGGVARGGIMVARGRRSRSGSRSASSSSSSSSRSRSADRSRSRKRNPYTKSKSTQKKKKQVKSKQKRQAAVAISSDEEEEVLYREMRARSRSRDD